MNEVKFDPNDLEISSVEFPFLKTVKYLKNLPSTLISLDLNDCQELLSISYLSPSLEYLSLKNCENLHNLPNLSKTHLNFLSCEGCSNLQNLPELPDSLMQLRLTNSAVENLPETLSLNLKFLDIRNTEISKLPLLPIGLETLGIRKLKLNYIIDSYINLIHFSNSCTKTYNEALYQLNHPAIVRLSKSPFMYINLEEYKTMCEDAYNACRKKIHNIQKEISKEVDPFFGDETTLVKGIGEIISQYEVMQFKKSPKRSKKKDTKKNTKKKSK